MARALAGSLLVEISLVAIPWSGGAAEAAPPTPREGESVVWVRLHDRGPLETATPGERLRVARAQLSERSWERRARRSGRSEALETDLPVHEAYVQALAERGARVRTVSRWLNAVSVVAGEETLQRLGRLPFVAALEPVVRRRAPRWEDFEREVTVVAPPPGDRGAAPTASGRLRAQQAPGDAAFYGGSHAQNRLIEADDLHAAGRSGAGILIAVLDTGFRETHAVFDSLEVVARRDFVHGDEIVANEPGQDPSSPNPESHGTWVLSTLAGYWPGVHIGVAYGAQVALAKTEWVASETPIEMDYWQMAAEWADSLGADVISSSVGYTEFDTPEDSYTYADLDGRTTTVTLAAVEAARRGITVVTAQGNYGNTAWFYLMAPADADSACAVGAVDSLGNSASFSSHGPTADGRIKPDVCAMGVRVQVASVSNDAGFVRPNGTSFATPAAAGLVALLLEEHPAWGPFEILEALRSTADRALTPDANYGFGIARGVAAADWTPSTVSAPPAGGAAGPRLALSGPQPSRRELQFRLVAGERGGEARLELYDVAGRRAARLWGAALSPREARLVTTSPESSLASGVYLAVLATPDGEAVQRVVFLR